MTIGRQRRCRRRQAREQRAADLPGNAGDQNPHHAGSKCGNSPAKLRRLWPSLSRGDQIPMPAPSTPQSMPSAGSFQRNTFSSAGL